jgi:luciferase family oxidoreductase group 1
MLQLSVLDQSPACAGHGEDEPIRESLKLAQQCETLGYLRFWVSEHHGLPAIVGSAPEILMAAIAARTRRIRIGSAGVMLPHYSAFKVAEQFRVLEALAPGRIDLGVGRAPGGDMRVARALNPGADAAADLFPEQVQNLQAWSSLPALRGITAHPRGPHVPQLWILGSSDHGAQLAAHLGLPYAFAYFFTDGQGVEQALDLYRTRYRPSERHPHPQATVCVWALVADDADTAWHHALSRDQWRIARTRGQVAPLQDPTVNAARGFDDAAASTLRTLRDKAFVGDAPQVSARLRQLAASLALDELVINTWAYFPKVGQRSYALLAKEFALSTAPGAAA